MASSRRRTWADTKLDGNVLAVGNAVELNLLADAPVSDTLTVARIIGDVTAMYTVNITVTDSLSVVDLGIGVASSEAFNVGGAALPSIDVTDEYPPRGWLYAASLPVWEKAESTGVISVVARFVFDLGAMRKIDKGILYLLMKNNNITIGGSMQVVGRVRVMCLT